VRDGEGREDHTEATRGFPHVTEARKIGELARVNGLALSEEDARDLQPYYDQQRRWLAELRAVIGDAEEPATTYSAAWTRDGSE